MEETMNLTIIFLRPTARVVGSGMAECRPGMVPFWSRLSTRSLVLPPLFKCETSRGLFIAVWFRTMFWLLFWDDHIFTLTPMFHMVRPPFFSDVERIFSWNRRRKLPGLFAGKPFVREPGFCFTDPWNLPHGRRKFRRDTNLTDWADGAAKKKQKNNVESIQLKRKSRYIQQMSPTFDVNVGLFFEFGRCWCDGYRCHDHQTKKGVILCYPYLLGRRDAAELGRPFVIGGISNLNICQFEIHHFQPFTFTTSLLRWLIWVWQEHTSGIWVCIGWESWEKLTISCGVFFGLEVGPGASETMVITWAIFFLEVQT